MNLVSLLAVNDFCIKVIVMPISLNGRVIVRFVAGRVKQVIRCLQRFLVFILSEKRNQEPVLACNYHKFNCITLQLLSCLDLRFSSKNLSGFMKFYCDNEGELFKFMSDMKCRLGTNYKYHKKFRPF